MTYVNYGTMNHEFFNMHVGMMSPHVHVRNQEKVPLADVMWKNVIEFKYYNLSRKTKDEQEPT
jgi:hypothetical protein